MTIVSALIFARALHYIALSVLFGAALFPFYGVTQSDGARASIAALLKPLLLVAAAVTLVSGLFWFALTAAIAVPPAGGTVTDIATLVRETAFGRVWLFRLVLAVGVVVLACGRQRDGRLPAVMLVSLVLLLSTAWISHGPRDDAHAMLSYRLLNAIHLVASGVWIGALAVLARLVRTSAARPSDLAMLHDALSRFSGIGSGVVGILTVSGMLNPGFQSSFQAFYGQLLLWKLAVFGAMLILAAANRFWLTPKLSRAMNMGNGLMGAVRALQASLWAESALAVLVLAIVGWLGTIPPGA